MKRSFALMALMAGLAGSMTLATAQDPKKPKADDKKPAAKADDKKPAAKADDKKADTKSGIEIYQDKADNWRYRIKYEDKTIAQPTKGYETKEEVYKQLELVKKILADVKPVEVKSEGK